jgi:hypothetical protein
MYIQSLIHVTVASPLPPKRLINLHNVACIQESVACGFSVLGVSIDGTSYAALCVSDTGSNCITAMFWE